MKLTLEEQWRQVINHWWENAAHADKGEMFSPFANACAFCVARDLEGREAEDPDQITDGLDCFGEFGNEMCPIANETMKRQCQGTPWFYVAIGTYVDGKFRKLHPAVFAWWLEDCHAGRTVNNFTREDLRVLIYDWEN